MGLDITAFQKVTFLRPRKEDEDWDGDTTHLVQAYPEFDSRSDDLPNGMYTTEGKTLSFRAGSYSGYNRWRAYLARMLGTTDREVWAKNEPGPFFELIHFSDCEGFIGPRTSEKLARDFFEWKERAVAFADTLEDEDERKWWLTLYHRWQDAFALAAGNGVVDFH